MRHVLKSSFSLLNADCVRLDERWNYKNVISPYHRLYYIGEGEAELSDASHVYQLKPGYLYMVPSFTLCNMRCQKQMVQYFVQFFELSADGSSLFADRRQILSVSAQPADLPNFVRLLEINPGRGLNRSDDPSFYEKHIFYKEYQQLNDTQQLNRFIETQGILLQLISRFLNVDAETPKRPRFIPEPIMEAISYIQLHMDQLLTVKYLAQRAGYNAEHFSRLFEKHTGTGPADYINEKRVERAQNLLLSSQLSFSAIAAKVGFNSQAYFSRVFKSRCGITPREFLVQNKL